ncbi:MAG: C25 family cysteine peptidase, partial [Aggregatilineales bacterium]
MRLERKGDEITLSWVWADGQSLDGLTQRWPVAPGSGARDSATLLPFAAWLIALPVQALRQQALPAWEVEQIDTEFRASLSLPGRDHALAEPLPNAWPLDVEEAGVMRGVRLARLRFFPARPEGQGWRIVTALRARLRLPAAPEAGGQSAPADDPMLRVLAAHVLNPEMAHRAPDRGQVLNAAAQSSALPHVLIDVAAPGLVAITRAMLNNAGLPPPVPTRLRLRQGGAEVPMLWEGDGDDVFEDEERLLFYAAPRFSRYANHDTWILEETGAPQPRMGSRSAAPGVLPAGHLWATQLIEQNTLYTPDCGCRPPALRDSDRWAWVNLRRGETWSYALNTAGLDASAPASLTLWLAGYTDPPQSPDHRVQVWLNGARLGESIWDSKQSVTATFAISAGLLAAPSTWLSVTLPGLAGVNVEGMWVDALAISGVSAAPQPGASYWGKSQPAAYTLPFAPVYLLDVTSPSSPTLLTGWQSVGGGVRFGDPSAELPRVYTAFAAPANPLRVRAPAALKGAEGDYHVIAPAQMMPALRPLIARRQAQGLAVVTQTLQAIYDHHGDGRTDPLAIRAYLSARYHTDTTRPAYVLLVGDGSLDPKQYRPNT